MSYKYLRRRGYDSGQPRNPNVDSFCVFRALGTDKPCIDERTDCKETLTQNPDVCQKFPAFASRYCRLSCGVCSGKYQGDDY